MLILKFVLKFVAILNKDATPKAIAGGMALGAIMGITPAGSLHNLVVLFLLMMLRVNFSAGLVGAAVFKLFSYLFDPLFNRLGYWLLVDVKPLQPLWERIYNTPVLPWFKLNNTLTLGSLVVSIVLFYPLYRLLIVGVVQYRQKLMTRIAKWRIVTLLKASSLYRLYARFS